MTLTREPGPSREQVIAQTVERLNAPCQCVPEHCATCQYFTAVLTLLQSAETVAQERDIAKARQAQAEVAVIDLRKWRDGLQAEHDRLTQEVERLNEHHASQLAAISVVTGQNTERSRRDRITPGHPYWTAAYGDAATTVDREMAKRARAEKAEAEATRLRGMWEQAKVRAYRELSIVEPNMDQHVGAQRVFSAVFEATPSGPAEEEK